MGAVLEISYFNSVVIAGGRTNSGESPGKYHIEENRIKAEFNGKAMDLGVKAYITDEEYDSRVRSNALIYSGIYNSRTRVNQLNQFPVGEEISRAVDIQNGSIQKLHAEDTNLNIFQENKVNAALIDKDAIFTAEGQPITASGAKVIGQITPYAGKYGISKNPESFAVFGTRKYFADKRRGVICRLSKDGITPISEAGMKDYFKDNLKACDSIYGAYDIQKNKYIITLESDDTSNRPIIDGPVIATSPTTLITLKNYTTVCYDERSGGWTSFYTFKANNGVSLSNEFYTFSGINLYKHHSDAVARGNFYGTSYNDPCIVESIFNDKPEIVKTFLTINYEGTTGWSMENFSTGGNMISGYNAYDDINTCYIVPKEGTLVGTETVGFVMKEGFYFSELRNKARDFFQDNSNFNTTGVKGYYSDVKMQYWAPEEDENASKAELFAINSEVIV